MKIYDKLKKELENNKTLNQSEKNTILCWMNRAYELGAEDTAKKINKEMNEKFGIGIKIKPINSLN